VPAFNMVEGEYRCDYAYHAQMEPLNAVASVAAGGDAVEIWAGTQSQTTATEAPAKFLGISRDKVKLHDLLMGGGFGRRGNRDVDFIMDAVMLSKEIGSPVKVMWTREDDVRADVVGVSLQTRLAQVDSPIYFSRLTIGVGQGGEITSLGVLQPPLFQLFYFASVGHGLSGWGSWTKIVFARARCQSESGPVA